MLQERTVLVEGPSRSCIKTVEIAYLVYIMISEGAIGTSIGVDNITENVHRERILQTITKTSQSPKQHQQHIYAICITKHAIFHPHFF